MFLERTIIFPENKTDFVLYEFMHIRLKPQSTKYVKAVATSNSNPRFVPIVLHANNLLKIYDITKKIQSSDDNTR
jgi:hypothetical protein